MATKPKRRPTAEVEIQLDGEPVTTTSPAVESVPDGTCPTCGSLYDGTRCEVDGYQPEDSP